jgi:hypothetical protein
VILHLGAGRDADEELFDVQTLGGKHGMPQGLIDAGMEIDVIHVTPPSRRHGREHRDVWLTARARSLLRCPN